MGEFFTAAGRKFEFGRTVGDAKRLAKLASRGAKVFVSVRCDDSAGWGRSSSTLMLSRAAFFKALLACDGDDSPLVSHLHVDDDGNASLWIGNPLATTAAGRPREIAA